MDKHTLRRHILQIIADEIDPGCATIDLVARHTDLVIRSLPHQDLVAVLRGLAAHGYLEDLRPGRIPLYKLTAAGRDQIDQETDLDEYVWGEHASKFH